MRKLWRFLTAPFRGLKNIYHFLTEVPENRPLTETLSAAFEQREEIFEHIEALRRHLIRSALVTALCVGVAFLFVDQVATFLMVPIQELNIKLQAVDVIEPLSVFMNIALMTGVAAAVPYIAFELWLYVAPALMPRARISSLVAIPLAGGLFIGGMAFAYMVILRTGLPFLLGIMPSVEAHPTAEYYYRFATSLIFWVGASFELPLVIYVLASLGIVTPKMLLRYWRVSIVVIAVIAAAITPTPDPLNMGLAMLPLIVLYFASIALSQFAVLGRQKEQERRERTNAIR